jgi:hypothetical protein
MSRCPPGRLILNAVKVSLHREHMLMHYETPLAFYPKLFSCRQLVDVNSYRNLRYERAISELRLSFLVEALLRPYNLAMLEK